MKWQWLKSCFLAGAMSLSALSACADMNENLPVPLKEAAAAYKAKGSGEFLSTLVKGSRLQYTDQTELAQAGELFKAIETLYGDYLGIEVVRSVSITSSIRVVYFVLNYERGPLYGMADLYKTKSGEIVTNSNVNTNLQEIIPSDLIANMQ